MNTVPDVGMPPTAPSGVSKARFRLRRTTSRLLRLLVVLLGLSIVSFLLVRLLPGGPAQVLVGVRASPEAIDRINAQLGLDEPLPVQYLRYMSQVLSGNLGESFFTGAPVAGIVADHIWISLQLIGLSILLSVLIAVPLAIISANARGRWPDRFTRSIVVVTFGFPSFWVGIVLIAILSLKLGIFPSGGIGEGFFDSLWHLFLPALTLTLTFLAVLVRSLRASLSDLLDEDYIDAARLKGIGTVRLWIHHILRIGLVPAIGILAMNAAYLLGTSVIVENVYALPGLGQQLVSAVLQRDFLVVQGITFTFGVLVVLFGLVIELLQARLDPRLRDGVSG